jgi:hypothetical protein
MYLIKGLEGNVVKGTKLIIRLHGGLRYQKRFVKQYEVGCQQIKIVLKQE